MKYLVVEIYENGREIVTKYGDFYKAREYASTRTGCMVADVTDSENNVLESWSCGTVAGELYIPPCTTKKHYEIRNGKVFVEAWECGRIVDLRTRKTENHIFFSFADRYNFITKNYMDKTYPNRMLADVNLRRILYTLQELALIRGLSKSSIIHD